MVTQAMVVSSSPEAASLRSKPFLTTEISDDSDTCAVVKPEIVARPNLQQVSTRSARESERTNAARLDAAYEAARLALRLWSAATNAHHAPSRRSTSPTPSPPPSPSSDILIQFRQEFPGKLQFALELVKGIVEKVDTTVDFYLEELRVLRDRCIYVTCCVAVVHQRRRGPRDGFGGSPSSGGAGALQPLMECLKEVNVLAERCGGRQGRFWRALRASATDRSISELHRCVGALTKSMGLRGVVLVENKVDNLLLQLVSWSIVSILLLTPKFADHHRHPNCTVFCARLVFAAPCRRMYGVVESCAPG